MPWATTNFYGTEMMHCKTQTLLSDYVAVNSNRFKSSYCGWWKVNDVMNHVHPSSCSVGNSH